MTAQKQLVVLGPPGCGKTTFLLSKVDQEMQDGTHPSRIAYVSFTRKAADEAAMRACTKFSCERKDLPYFRTLHSLAFQELGMTKQQVMGAAQYKKLGLALGLTFSDYMDFEEGLPVSARDGDQILFLVSMARATLRTLEEQYKAYQQGETNWFKLKQFDDSLRAFKEDTGMLDFSDMLDTFVDTCAPLDIDVAVIDEAQDLSKQQWRMARHAVSRAKRVYIAGDDDQAIYRWSGADVDSFLTLPGERHVLNQSYRLPRSVHKLCSRISARISKRYAKDWNPRDEEGSVTHLALLDDLKWTDGSYLLLARNVYQLQKIETYVRSSGIPYTIRNRSSVSEASVQAIVDWERLRRGDLVPAERVRNIYKHMRSRSGVGFGHMQLPDVDSDTMLSMVDLKTRHGLLRDDIWHEALEKIAVEEREFYLAALRRREKISIRPRVHISTIHGVKGGEADHVVLLSDMALRTYNNYREDPDDEHRVAYVGASRARQTLSIVMPATDRSYPY